MEAIQNKVSIVISIENCQLISIISIAHQSKDMEEVVQVLTSFFKCVKKENNDKISDIKYLREEINDLISDLKDDVSTIEKKMTSIRRD